MESICFGVFLLIFFGIAALLATPIAVAIGAATAERRRKDTSQNENRPNPVMVGIISFILLMVFACIVLLIWNPHY